MRRARPPFPALLDGGLAAGALGAAVVLGANAAYAIASGPAIGLRQSDLVLESAAYVLALAIIAFVAAIGSLRILLAWAASASTEVEGTAVRAVVVRVALGAGFLLAALELSSVAAGIPGAPVFSLQSYRILLVAALVLAGCDMWAMYAVVLESPRLAHLAGLAATLTIAGDVAVLPGALARLPTDMGKTLGFASTVPLLALAASGVMAALAGRSALELGRAMAAAAPSLVGPPAVPMVAQNIGSGAASPRAPMAPAVPLEQGKRISKASRAPAAASPEKWWESP
ncbi:MAG: hypothetical protein ACYDDF_12740 [Thermoplasmatota archaeon]